MKCIQVTQPKKLEKAEKWLQTWGDSDKSSILGVLKSLFFEEVEGSYSQLPAEVPDGDDARRVGEKDRRDGDSEVWRFVLGGVGPSSLKPWESSKASSSMSLIWEVKGVCV